MDIKGKLPLEGIKVVDFGQMVNVPMAAKYLGDYGATVVQVESPVQATSRLFFPFSGGKPGPNRSGTFTSYNSSKYNITLNFNNPEGLEVAKRLIAWSDVLIDNYAPGTKEKWGLTYDDVKKEKPDIIMLSSTMLGETGQHRMQKGTGEQLSSLGGLTHLTGWPDRVPVGTPNAYTDFIAPFYILVSIIAALGYRQKTGRGSYIDLSQFEAGISFLSHIVLDYTFNGRVQEAIGNRCQYAAPHGAYRCQGNDRWCVIAVFTDEEWMSFCKVIGESELTKSPKFATLSSRKNNEDELDRLVEQWTINYPAEEVMKILQQAGVASGVVQNAEDLRHDPQLNWRHHFVMVQQPEMGMYAHEGSAFKLSKTPSEVRPAPCYGEHTEYICTKLIGMSDKEFNRLFDEGVFTGQALEKIEMSEKYLKKAAKKKEN